MANISILLWFHRLRGPGVGIGLLVVMWLFCWLRSKPPRQKLFSNPKNYLLEEEDDKGGFEKLLASYLDIAKLVVGLASGSVVLLVGSVTVRSGQLPESFAPPLFLLALCIIYALIFMVLVTRSYDVYRNKARSYSRMMYTTNQAFGYGGLLCFCGGYVWLIAIITAQPK